MKIKKLVSEVRSLNSPDLKKFIEGLIVDIYDEKGKENYSWEIFQEWFLSPCKREENEIENIPLQEMVEEIGINKTLRVLYLRALREKGGYKKGDSEFAILF